MADEFISLNELAKELGIAYPRAVALHDAGALPHVAQVNHTFLFKPDQLKGFRATLANYGMNRAIKGNASAQKKNPTRNV